MSRGLGRLQRALFAAIQRHGKPMTFEDIRNVIRQDFEMDDGAKLYPSFERSLRRALHRMVRTSGLIAIGDGGRGDPYRYFVHPMIIGMMAKTPETEALQQALQADPGAEKAVATLIAFPQSSS